MVIAITISDTANVAAAMNADHPGPLVRTRVSANAASAAIASHHAERNHPIVHGWPMKVGASVHNSQRGDQNSSSADVPSRALFSNRPSCPTASVIPIPMLIHNSRCCAARSGDPLGALRNATAIGSMKSSSPETIGRPGGEAPPHQIPNAPTVASSAAKITMISSASRRSGPPARHICHKPVAAST